MIGSRNAIVFTAAGEILLTAENRVNKPVPDLTAHAELELIRKASALSD